MQSISRFVAVVLLLFSLPLSAEEFPVKPITLIVPFGASGPVDVMSRLIAKPLSKELGQPVVVVSRPSTGGIVGMETVLKAPPDGYTLFAHTNSVATLTASTRNVKFDPLSDFTPIGAIADVPMIVVGKRTLKPKTFSELQSYIHANQKTINVASGGIGTTSHLCALALLEQLHVNLQIVPYKGAGPALTDLEGGQVDLMCDQITTTQQPIKAGLIKAFAAASKNRIPTMPNLLTLHEQGLRNFDMRAWYALFTTKDTPPDVVAKLSRALQASVKDPEFLDSLKMLGASAVTNDRINPDRVTQDLKREREKWQPLVLKDRVRNDQ
jgi:tripartite-type tricarboxylate transporter receptor subunit TctC